MLVVNGVHMHMYKGQLQYHFYFNIASFCELCIMLLLWEDKEDSESLPEMVYLQFK